jgi:two-component system chemotaxis sensor kinase CheA
MDVVKNNIERINGTIDVQSRVGKGSTINIKIPLTLAIIPALIIRSAGDRYAIPQASLVELVRLEGEESHAKIETIRGAPVYRLRGKLLPLVYLQQELADEQSATVDDDACGDVTNIVVLQADQHQFGLVVQHVLDTEEIVVKPLGKQVNDLEVFAGATIMGDGNVALILDVLGLAHRASVLSKRREAMEADGSDLVPTRATNLQTLLLFETAGRQRMALPLSRVTRLEKLPLAEIEPLGRCPVVQYWGQVMPLVHVSSCLAGEGLYPSWVAADVGGQETLEVVVLTIQSRSLGLVVDRILDTVEEAAEIQPVATRKGILGTVVVQGQVTELLDLDELLRIAGPELFAQGSSVQVGA